MPNTSPLSQILPNFNAPKSGQPAYEAKTNTNFNQILKNEVANKVKKPPTNTSKPQVNNQATSSAQTTQPAQAAPVQNGAGAIKEADTSEKSLSTEDKKSDERDVAALTVPDETSNLLSFVGDVNALNANKQIEADKSDTSETIAINTTTVSQNNSVDTDLSNYASPPDATAPAPGQLGDNQSIANSNTQSSTSTFSINDSRETSAELATKPTAQTSDLSATHPALDQSKLRQTIEENSAATYAISASENQANVDKTVQEESLSGLTISEKPETTKLTASPPAVDKNTSEKIDSTDLARTTKTSKTNDLNANERSASDKFSIELKGLAQEVRRGNIDEKNRDAREFKVAELPKVESLPSSPPVPATLETTSVSPASNFIGPRVGTKAWDQAIGQKIVWMVAGGEQSAQLTLNPPDLGPVQVVLSISDSQVDASFVSSHLDVREAIEAAAPKLREMMDSAGISLSGFSVSAQSTPSGSSFNSEGSSRNNATLRASTSSNQETPASTTTSARPSSNPQGLVDTFV
ncbi:flagellar hook-length control protein FliK [Undibacterium danionis]|uniref:Flagellar hook-length control protein FliK n=1 Tax=Undibacterium danionis TaxID=1812100 RepID=A0ABV6I951_9BURK